MGLRVRTTDELKERMLYCDKMDKCEQQRFQPYGPENDSYQRCIRSSAGVVPSQEVAWTQRYFCYQEN